MFFLRRCGKFCQRWSKGGATFHSPVTCRPFGQKCEIRRSPVRKFRFAPVFHKFSYIARWIILYQNTLLSSESCQKSPHTVRNVFLLRFSNFYISKWAIFQKCPSKTSPVTRLWTWCPPPVTRSSEVVWGQNPPVTRFTPYPI